MLTNTPEAKEFIEYCKANKISALTFFAGLYFDIKESNTPKALSQLLFCKIFEEYASIIEDIKNEWKKNPYNDKGAYIAPLPETFIKKYVKSLINKIHLL